MRHQSQRKILTGASVFDWLAAAMLIHTALRSVIGYILEVCEHISDGLKAGEVRSFGKKENQYLDL